MASIVLSFVGNQDPYSSTTKEEGSIITLVRHLQSNNNVIKKILMFSTQDTKEGAELTKEWLELELNIASKIIESLPVNSQLSQDPVNLLLATQEARQGLEKYALPYQEKGDYLEFNASSGTPVMKSAWSILQASGYAPNSRVWQVRNPHKLQPEQELVFETNVTVLKNEFDAKVIKRQVENYNYSGALETLKASNYVTSNLQSLLEYGRYRLAFDFDNALNILNKNRETFNSIFRQEISILRSKKSMAILKEVYYKILTKQKNKEYADLLVLLFAFQENLLRFLIKQKLLPDHLVDKDWKDINNEFKDALENFEKGQLLKYLENYHLRNGDKLRLELDKPPNRTVMQTILEYYPDCSSLLTLINNIEPYCGQRNDSVHELKGISKIEQEEKIIRDLRQIFKLLNNSVETNPFDLLNSQINLALDNYLRGQN